LKKIKTTLELLSFFFIGYQIDPAYFLKHVAVCNTVLTELRAHEEATNEAK
jgi:hypothetical protein